LFFCLDFNPENDRQAEDRCHRIGQERPVSVYKLYTAETVDEAIYEMGEKKRELSEAVLSSSSHHKGEKMKEDHAIGAILQQALQRSLMKSSSTTTTTSSSSSSFVDVDAAVTILN
jgi:SNF2 family DNA or RNA helicase